MRVGDSPVAIPRISNTDVVVGLPTKQRTNSLSSKYVLGISPEDDTMTIYRYDKRGQLSAVSNYDDPAIAIRDLRRFSTSQVYPKKV